MTATTLERRAPESARTTRKPNAILAAILAGQFMAVLDVTIVNVAAPTMKHDLGASGAGLQMIIAGYTISYAVLLITGARLGDMYGYRRGFMVGLSIFTAASLACGLAPTTESLIAFRLVQGAGAALMIPQVLSLIQRTFVGPSRLRALGLYSAVIACGAVVGQVVGGVLVSADIAGTGWRPVFLVNVPIGLVLLTVVPRLLPGDSGSRGKQLDPLGVVTLSLTVLALVVPLVLGHEENWPLWGWISLGLSPLLFALFLRVEQSVARRGGRPLVSLQVIRAPGLLPGMAALWLSLTTYSGFLFATAVHLQGALGDSALRTGLTFAPGAVGFALVGINWRRLPQSWHAAVIPVGFVLAGLSYLGLDPVLRGAGQGGVPLEVLLFVMGLGLGFTVGPIMNVALKHVPVADASDASGLMVSMAQLGQVTGVATIGTLYLSLTGSTALDSAHAVAASDVALALIAVVAAGFSIVLVLRQRMVRELATAS